MPDVLKKTILSQLKLRQILCMNNTFQVQKVISQSEEKTGQKALTGFSLSQHLKRG